MSRLLTLKSAAVLAVVGTAAGIFLGNRAIDAVNPFFYSPLPSQSFAALSPYRNPTRADATLISAEETRDALGECVGCRTYPEEYDPRQALDAGPPEGDYSTSSDAQYAVLEEPVAAAPAQPDPERVAVQRYASYEVTQPQPGVTITTADPAAAGENAELLRAAEDRAVPRGPAQLIY